jgi:hypothetical protein
MKHRITLSIALVVTFASLSLPFFATTTQAQQRSTKFRFDTGVVRLGPQQILRLAVDWGDGKPDAVDAADYVLFRRMEYGQETCGSDGVCKLAVTSQTTSNPIRLSPGEAAFYTNSPGGGLLGVRIVALSNRRSVRATATITNIITGETTSHIIMANTEGDFH